MSSLLRFWRSLFDIRPGEYRKTAFMALYLMLVLFAYYILKPVSRALFLNSFDIDKLPWLYVLIAAVGGVLAYFYTKLAVRSSLRRAVDLANIFCTVVLVLFWWLIQFKAAWIIYAFNIWVSLFSIILVSQGWIVAANVFTAREAKRLYGILGVGSVIGAAFGGQFTAVAVYYIGTTNLLLASAAMVVLSYVAYRFAVASEGANLAGAKAAEKEEEFSFGEIARSIKGNRHLQIIIGIISITFIVDVLVEFQFSAMAKQTYQGRDLTAFLGNFYGFWLNLVTFVLQLFLTSFVVSRFGVGGTLQIMPVSIALASVAALVAPGLLSTAGARITEASTRYSFNKTGTELLYLPLPLELRNRTKAFVDVFIDRLARGMGGMLLVFLTVFFHLQVQQFAIVVLVFAAIWILLSVVAKREYMSTVRRRLELRRFDLDSARISVTGREVIALLENTSRTGLPKQAAYALGLLASAPGYDVAALAFELSDSPHPEVRGKAFELLGKAKDARAEARALAEIRSTRGLAVTPAAEPAVFYVLAVSAEPADLGRRLLDHPSPAIQKAAMKALSAQPELLGQLVDDARLRTMAESDDASQRALAAMAIRALGSGSAAYLGHLLIDADPIVASESIRTAGELKQREHVPALIHHLGDSRLRGVAIEALAAFGPRILGTLTDLLEDGSVPLTLRRHIPRTLVAIPEQRSVDVLKEMVGSDNMELRAVCLKALNKLREQHPELNYDAPWFLARVHAEARYYFETYVALATLRQLKNPPPATSLLVRTLNERLRQTLERVFRMVGLKYPPKQIYAAYLAINRRSTDEVTAALEFLDNILERELKRVLLPLLDEDAVLVQRARELYKIEKKSVAQAFRELIASGDPWLASCAIASAAELKILEVGDDVRKARSSSTPDIAAVARASEPAFA